MGEKGYLILENGQIYQGLSFGSIKEVKGEVVFNTGMVGYPEGFTDPSYYGQILVSTYPLIGNYGVPDNLNSHGLNTNFESDKIQIRGLIVTQYIDHRKHWQSRQTLSEWLSSQQIPALSGIDTRFLTKTLREKGVMKGIITFSNPPESIGWFSFYDINKDNLVPFVSCNKIIKYGSGKIKVLFIDCGLKLNQIRLMLDFDTTVIRVPWNYNPFTAKNPPQFDALFISNGPGDPRNMPQTISTIGQALKREIPTFGICLGHQLMALATGAEVYKLKYGHRGQNQPVINQMDGKSYITSQNHGYSVIIDSIPREWNIWFTNLNDQTNEGIIHKKKPYFSAQFHPEDKPGPNDCRWLFAYYFDRVKKWLKI